MNAVTKIPAMQVYAKIAAVQAALAKTGISKSGRNTAQNYNFRGIDQVYAALAPLLAEHGLCILPRMISRHREERVSVKVYNNERKESVLFYVTVEAEFDFVAAEDGSCHTIRTFGEAMDSGDKATNKAMSAAYKYAALMAFAVPTEGDNDADATTHAVEPQAAAPSEMPDAEYSKLANLMKATSTQAGPLLKHYKVANLRHLNIDDYTEAVGHLNAKLAKMAKEETDKKAAASNLAEELDDAIPNF